MTAREWLDAVQARAEAVTYLGGESQEVADDALALVAALRAVLDLHVAGVDDE